MKKIITISRQYGSGGRTIARSLAEGLGFKCYDWEIIEELAKETGLSQQYIMDACENASTSNPFFFAMERMSYSRFGPNLSVKDELFKTMREIIENIAKKGNSVFVGRCADYILRNRKDALHVFIYANMDYRAEKMLSIYGENMKDPIKELEEKDKKRKLFYSNYTGREWGLTPNYSICLNSGEVGEDKCVKIIESIVRGE